MQVFTYLLVLLGVLYSQAQQSIIKKEESDQKFPECGSSNPNGHFVDDRDSKDPGPFHDLTEEELKKLREFLEKDPKIQAAKSSNATLKSSYIFQADIHLPKKEEVLNYLDKGGPKPQRKAHVIMFRGDLAAPVVEECVCGPLPDITKCERLNRTTRRNPVEFSLRPLSGLEIKAINEDLLKRVDHKVGKILQESYGAKFTECSKKEDCLASSSAPVNSGISKDINKRLMWITAMHNVPFPSLHTLDFSILVDMNDPNSEMWTIEKIWYCNKVFDSLDELLDQYDSNSIQKTKVTKPTKEETLFSKLQRRGEPQPAQPQRPPRLVEPDGKRYTVKEKKVEYMGWTFNYRLSPFTGPVVHDVKFKGERIAYEIALSDIATTYSSYAPFAQTLNNIESSRMLGSRSKAVIPGADCPETGTSLSAKFMNQYDEEPAVYNASWCIFENNNGHPLRRHLSYKNEEGGFYGGMLDSALTLRSAMSNVNHDYVIDFIFHINGVCEVKIMNSGYLMTTFSTDNEKPFGHRIQEKITGNQNLQLFHIKVDLDIGGTSNRYEQLEIQEEKQMLSAFLDKPYSQSKLTAHLKTTEKESVTDFKDNNDKYHIIHNNEKKNNYNESRAYRIETVGAINSMLADKWGVRRDVLWANQKMVVTKQKDDEDTSSSIYAMLDGEKPAINFQSFVEDNEKIVDDDLVVWVTAAKHILPRSEDIPNAATVGGHVSVLITPHNYHSECPSIASRDAIYIDYKDPKVPSKGVKVDRNGNTRDQCVVPKSNLEEVLEAQPDWILESRRRNPTDF